VPTTDTEKGQQKSEAESTQPGNGAEKDQQKLVLGTTQKSEPEKEKEKEKVSPKEGLEKGQQAEAPNKARPKVASIEPAEKKANLGKSEQKAAEPPISGKLKKATVHIGIVRVADEIKGYSSVKCTDGSLKDDVCVPSSVADPEILRRDDLVAFSIEPSEENTPRACPPFWKFMTWANHTKRPSAFAEYRGHIGQAPEAGSEGTFVTIECEDVVAALGAPARISQRAMTECILAAGDAIAFDLASPAPLGRSGGRTATAAVEVAVPVWRCCTAPDLDEETHKRSVAKAQSVGEERIKKKALPQPKNAEQPEAKRARR